MHPDRDPPRFLRGIPDQKNSRRFFPFCQHQNHVNTAYLCYTIVTMARRKRRYRRKLYINPETIRGIGVLLLFAVSGILLLSMAELAGNVGVLVNTYVTLLFGIDTLLVPVVFLVLAAVSLYPDKRWLTPFNGMGILLFFLSFNALINVVTLRNLPSPTQHDLMNAGGFVGVLLERIFENAFGFWGAILVLFVLILASILLTLNASLRNLVDAYARVMTPVFQFLKQLSFRRSEPVQIDDEDEEEEDDMDDEGEEDFLDEDEDPEDITDTEEEPAPAKKQPKAPSRAKEISKLGETALTTHTQRQIEIPMNLLEHRSTKAKSGDTEHNKTVIHETLAEFGMSVEMGEVAVGPTVTQYTMRPPRGVKLTKILSLQNDLALALAAHPIRIEAPIPGKSLVGIEVPNQSVATVSLRELLESDAYLKHKSPLTFGLGKDVAGEIWAAELDRMPHLLVAGATGSGKSVCLNTIILSLLYANGPDDLKLIMIDPKRVELTSYEGIPHLLIPPITKVEDAINALKWTIREMERRLDVLSNFGAKDIKSFNKRSREKMPYIAVIIDELADLMMTSGREVEASIVRIAQLARATGIHLILATQRPSVDVITGTIKANFPGRIAFAVASQTDSRTILDVAGADKLLGRGDMLFSTAELSKPKRIQGAFVSEQEIEQVVNFLRHSGEPDYNYSITEREKSGSVFDGADEDEQIINDAVEYIIQSGKASTSMLQRRLRIGYSRAARLMDILEDKGVIGPQDGARPREVLVTEWPPEMEEEEVAYDDEDNSLLDSEDSLEPEGTEQEDTEEGEDDTDESEWEEEGDEDEIPDEDVSEEGEEGDDVDMRYV